MRRTTTAPSILSKASQSSAVPSRCLVVGRDVLFIVLLLLHCIHAGCISCTVVMYKCSGRGVIEARQREEEEELRGGGVVVVGKW